MFVTIEVFRKKGKKCIIETSTEVIYHTYADVRSQLILILRKEEKVRDV